MMRSPVSLPSDASPVAREIFRRMTGLGLTQKELARNAGVNETYVANIFAGKSKNPKTAHLEKVAKALGCDLPALTNPKGPGSEPQSGDRMYAVDVFPLTPEDIAMLRLYRWLPQPARQLVLEYATQLLPPRPKFGKGCNN